MLVCIIGMFINEEFIKLLLPLRLKIHKLKIPFLDLEVESMLLFSHFVSFGEW